MAQNEGLLLDPAHVPLITRFIREKRHRHEIRLYAGDDIGYYDENEMYLRNRPGTISTWNGCQAGLRVVGIDSVGNVKGCLSIYCDDFIEGNLREESLAQIWHKEGSFAYNRQFDVSQLTGKCARCDRGRLCRGGCRGSSYFTSGSLFENTYCCYPGNKKQEGLASNESSVSETFGGLPAGGNAFRGVPLPGNWRVGTEGDPYSHF
jgi:radical SAM protein with 4Fe4S-binding SPASM domain